MTVTADRLADRIIPQVPVRQWVLSFPRQVRYHLARNAKLRRKVVAMFMQEVFRDTCRRSGVSEGECGSVTVPQRFGSALNANLHLHSIVLDGVFTNWRNFRRASEPTNEDLTKLVKRLAKRIVACLKRHGVPIGPGEEEGESVDVLGALQSASIQGMIALAEEPRLVRKVGGRQGQGLFENPAPKECCADAEGFSLHAGVRIEAKDREGLRRLCRYILRPPFSGERFSFAEDGRVVYRLRRPWYDGTTHLVLEPLELMEKLAALVPVPGAHTVQYHGVLARHHGWRPEVIGVHASPSPEARRASSEDWATLLKKTFGVDALKCPNCGGAMKVIAAITEAEAIKRILAAMGQATDAPAAAPARSPPGRDLLDESSQVGPPAAG
jgi:hypothetical protein